MFARFIRDYVIFTGFAFELSVPVITRRTRAIRHPISDPTLGIGSASSLLQTRISAHPIGVTFFVRFAIVILIARISRAFDVRLTLEPVWTHANCPVVDNVTLGILSARYVGRVAGILAFLVQTRPIAGTIRVRTTPDHTHPVRAYVAIWTLRAGTTLGRTRVIMAHFSTRTVVVGRTSFYTESGFRIAGTRSVTFQNRLATSDQRISIESGFATTLNSVIDDLALGTWTTSGGSITGC